MSGVVRCTRTLAVHFPPTIYRSSGSSQVLPELVKSLDVPNVQCIQFVPNGIVRVTYKESAQCDAALSGGVAFRGSNLRVTPVDARTRVVYLRDLPAEVPDEPVRAFFRKFGIVHSLAPQFHPGFPDVATGTRVVRVTLTKDIPSTVRIAGYDARLWYQGQPQSCPICRQFGHRVRDCPLNGRCRRCRQPGHMARECTSRRPTSFLSDPVPVADLSAPDQSAPVPGMPESASAVVDESAAADASDVPDASMSDSEVDPDCASEPGSCSGDEEITRAACLVTLTSALRKRSLSETQAELVGALDSGEPAPGFSVSSFGGSQPSLLDLETSDPDFVPAPGMPESASAAVAAVPGTPEPASAVVADPVSRSLPRPKKRKFVDLPPSGFSPQQELAVLARPYHGILPRTTYAYVCADTVKPDVPVVMDFGYLTRSVVADYCSFELDRFVKYVHRDHSRPVASSIFPSDVAVSTESLPAGTPAKFPGQ